MNGDKRALLELNIHIGKIMKSKESSQRPTEKELEDSLSKVLSLDPPISALIDKEKTLITHQVVILIANYSDKIETLVNKYLHLAYQAFLPNMNIQYMQVILHECMKIGKNSNSSLDNQIIGLQLTSKIILVLDKKTLLAVTPGILSVLLKCFIGQVSKNEKLLKASVECLTSFLEAFIGGSKIEFDQVFDYMEKSKSFKTLQGMFAIPDLPQGTSDILANLRKSTSTLPKELDIHKKAIDKVFEAFYSLKESPLLTGSKVLSESCVSAYGNFFCFALQIFIRAQHVHAILLELVFCLPTLPPKLPEMLRSNIAIETAQNLFQNSVNSIYKDSLEGVAGSHLSHSVSGTLSAIRHLGRMLKSSEVNSLPKLSIKTVLRCVGFSTNAIISTNLGAVVTGLAPSSRTVYTNSNIFQTFLKTVCDYLPHLNYSSEFVSQFLHLFGGFLMDYDILAQMAEILDDLQLYTAEIEAIVIGAKASSSLHQEFPSRNDSNSTVPGLLSIGSIGDHRENNNRKYQAVKEPLDELCNVLILFVGILLSRDGLRKPEEEPEIETDFSDFNSLDSSLDALFNNMESMLYSLKDTIDFYIERISITQTLKRQYITTIQYLIILALYGLILRKINVHQECCKKQEKEALSEARYGKLSEVNSFVFNLLSSDTMDELSAHAVDSIMQAFCREFSQAMKAVEENNPDSSEFFGVPRGTDISTTSLYIQYFSQFLIEQTKFDILNYPRSRKSLQRIRLLSTLTKFYSQSEIMTPGIYAANTNMLEFLSSCPLLSAHSQASLQGKTSTHIGHHIQRASFQMMRNILTCYKLDKAVLKADCERRVKEEAIAPSNIIRRVVLKLFPGFSKTKSNEKASALYSILELFTDVLFEVPSSIESKENDLSANEPYNCMIDNTAAALLSEIWGSFLEEVKVLTLSYLLVEESFGALVLEFAIMKSRTREAYLTKQLAEFSAKTSNEPLSPESLTSLVDTIKCICKFSSIPTKTLIVQAPHARGFLVKASEIILQWQMKYPRFFEYQWEMVKLLCLNLFITEMASVDSIKTAINTVKLLKGLKEDIVQNRPPEEFQTILKVINFQLKQSDTRTKDGVLGKYTEVFLKTARECIVFFETHQDKAQ